MDIYICNKGTIPVKVAMALEYGLLGKTHLTGWWTIEPGSGWSCPLVYSGSTTPTCLFAFSIADRNGRKGIVTYQPSRERDGQSGTSVYYAVPRSAPLDKTDYQPELRKADSSEIVIPFSWKIEQPDSYAQSREYTINLEASPDDPIALYFSKPISKLTVKIKPNPVIQSYGVYLRCLDYRPIPNSIRAEVHADWCSCIAKKIENSGELSDDQKEELAHKAWSGILPLKVRNILDSCTRAISNRK